MEHIGWRATLRALSELDRNVWALSLASFTNDIASEMLLTLMPIYLYHNLKSPILVIGLIEGIALGVTALIKVFAGWLSDHVKSRRVLTALGYGLSAVARPILALANSWPVVASVRWIDRIGKGFRGAPRDALLADSIFKHQRGVSFGLHRASETAGAVISLGMALYIVATQQPVDSDLEKKSYHILVYLSIPFGVATVASIIFIARDIRTPKGYARRLVRSSGSTVETTLEEIVGDIKIGPDEKTPLLQPKESPSSDLRIDCSEDTIQLYNGDDDEAKEKRDTSYGTNSEGGYDIAPETGIARVAEFTSLVTTRPLAAIGYTFTPEPSPSPSPLPSSEFPYIFDSDGEQVHPSLTSPSKASSLSRSQSSSVFTMMSPVIEESPGITESPVLKGSNEIISTGNVSPERAKRDAEIAELYTKYQNSTRKWGFGIIVGKGTRLRQLRNRTQSRLNLSGLSRRPSKGYIWRNPSHNTASEEQVSLASNVNKEKGFLAKNIERLGTVYFTLLSIFFVFQIGNPPEAFLVLLAKEKGITVLDILALMLVYNLTYAAVSAPAGWISDRVENAKKHSRAYIIVAGWILRCFTMSALSVSTNSTQIWVLFCLHGAYMGIVEGTVKAVVVDVVERDAAVRGLAFGAFNGIMGCADLISCIVAGALWQQSGPSKPFQFAALTGALAALLLLVWRQNVEPAEVAWEAERSLHTALHEAEHERLASSKDHSSPSTAQVECQICFAAAVDAVDAELKEVPKGSSSRVNSMGPWSRGLFSPEDGVSSKRDSYSLVQTSEQLSSEQERHAMLEIAYRDAIRLAEHALWKVRRNRQKRSGWGWANRWTPNQTPTSK